MRPTDRRGAFAALLWLVLRVGMNAESVMSQVGAWFSRLVGT